MKRNIGLGFLDVIVLVGGWWYLHGRPGEKNPNAFSSQAMCEEQTGKDCVFYMCDLVPPGKTYQNVCPDGSYWAPGSEESHSNNQPLESASQQISGEYSFSDMTGLAYFYVPRPMGGGQGGEYSFGDTHGGVDSKAQTQIVGSLSSFSDSCNLSIEATIEIANPVLVKEDFKHGVNEYQAQFVRLISKGRVFDNCVTTDDDGQPVVTRRERN
jgi:hypothetical protein